MHTPLLMTPSQPLDDMRNLPPYHPFSNHMFTRRACIAIQFHREPINDMLAESGVAIFWDFETAKIEGKYSGCQVARDLNSIADQFGVVKSFRTYLDVMNQLDDNFSTIRKELYSSGVTMVDCPSHSGRDIADKVIIVDMLSFIMDQPPPYTIVVATGDNDLCFTLAILRRRRYKVILVCPLQRDCENLAMQADETRRVDWIGTVSGNASSPPPLLSSPSSSSSILSYAGFDTRRSVQNSITDGRKIGSTAEQSKKLTSLHIPSTKTTRNRVDSGSQRSNDGMTPSPGSLPHNLLDTEKPQDHTGKPSSPFFPPHPSFPLEARPKANISTKEVYKPVAGKKSPSPQSTEEFSVVDRPRNSPPSLDSRSSLVPTPISAARQASATTHFPATSSSEFREVPSQSVGVPVAATQRTDNPTISTLDTSNIGRAPLTTASTSVPAATPSIAAAPIATTTEVSAPALTSTISTKATSETTASQSLPMKYRSLVKLLQIYHRGGKSRVNGSTIAAALVKGNSQFYASVGVKKWGQYASGAVADGIIVALNGDKIYLREEWKNVSV